MPHGTGISGKVGTQRSLCECGQPRRGPVLNYPAAQASREQKTLQQLRARLAVGLCQLLRRGAHQGSNAGPSRPACQMPPAPWRLGGLDLATSLARRQEPGQHKDDLTPKTCTKCLKTKPRGANFYPTDQRQARWVCQLPQRLHQRHSRSQEAVVSARARTGLKFFQHCIRCHLWQPRRQENSTSYSSAVTLRSAQGAIRREP